jgi:hypothetical protein
VTTARQPAAARRESGGSERGSEQPARSRPRFAGGRQKSISFVEMLPRRVILFRISPRSPYVHRTDITFATGAAESEFPPQVLQLPKGRTTCRRELGVETFGYIVLGCVGKGTVARLEGVRSRRRVNERWREMRR